MPVAPSFLALDNRDGGAVRVWRFRNGTTPIQVGNDLPSSAAESTTNNTYRTAGRRVIQFNGAVYAISNDGVYKLQNDDSWSKASIDGGLTFTSPSTSTNNTVRSGFEIFYRNNKPYLIGAFKTAAGGIKAFWLDPDTTQWVEGNSTFQNPQNGSLGNGILSQAVFRDKIYYYLNHANSNDQVYSYTPATDTWALASMPGDRGSSRPVGDLCVFNDKLYFVYIRSDLNAVKLSELNYNTNAFNAVVDLGPGAQMMYNPTTPYCLYTDGTYLYVVALRTNNRFYTWRVTTALSAAELDMFPTVTTLTGHNNASGFQRAYDFSIPGTTTPMLFYKNSSSISNPIHTFKHVGPSSKWKFIGRGGTIDQILPHGAIGGSFDFIPSENDVIITNSFPTSNGETISFKVSGGGTKSVMFYYALGTAFPLTQLALKDGSAFGNSAIAVGNQVDNVLADGVTEYTVDIDGITAAIESDTDIRVLPITF